MHSGGKGRARRGRRGVRRRHHCPHHPSQTTATLFQHIWHTGNTSSVRLAATGKGLCDDGGVAKVPQTCILSAGRCGLNHGCMITVFRCGLTHVSYNRCIAHSEGFCGYFGICLPWPLPPLTSSLPPPQVGGCFSIHSHFRGASKRIARPSQLPEAVPSQQAWP